MSNASSITSRRTFGHNERRASDLMQPIVKIRLRNKNGETISPTQTTFSTLDEVEGTVTINSPTEVRFDELEIALIGNKLLPSHAVCACQLTIDVRRGQSFQRSHSRLLRQSCRKQTILPENDAADR